MYQPILCNQESRGQEPTAKRSKMNDCTFKLSFQDLQRYLFGNTIGSDKPIDNSANQQISNLIKDMPNIVRLCLSSIPGTGFGVQATQTIPIGAWIGPYQGNFIEPDKANRLMDSSYLWEIFKDGKLHGYIDGSDENTASWMRFIRCARHKEEQNLYAFQYMNKIYYRTYKTIEPGKELLVWYDQMYTQYMGIPCEGIYDMASSIGTSHLPKTIAKVTEDKVLTPPTTPTKSTDNPFTRQPINVAGSPTNKTPVQGCTMLSSSRATISPLQPIQRLEFPEDRAIANQNETRKRAFDSQPIKIVDQKGSPNQNPDNHLQISTFTSIPCTVNGDTKVASVQQFNGLPINSDTRVAFVQQFNGLPINSDTRVASVQQFNGLPINIDENQARSSITSNLSDRLPPPISVKLDTAQAQPGDPDATRLKCGQCKQVFIQRSILQTHICAGVLLKPYQCGHCSETFSNPGLMRLHAVAHQGKKPFKCGYCNRSFSGATTLNNHIRTHTGEKPFDCLKCGKSFTKGLQLSRHLNMPGDCSCN